MATQVSFGGNTLSTFPNGTAGNGIIVQGIQHAGKSAKLAQNYILSHSNKTVIPFVEYPGKPITLTGQIVGTTIADCDNQIDLFNALLTPVNAALCFDYNGGSLNRLYYATANLPNVDRPEGLAYADFNVTFTANTFGQDTTTSSLLSATGRTLGSYQDSITLAGSAPWQVPLITITYSTIGSAPVAGTVSLSNNSTGQQINITRTWAATDVLYVDCSLGNTTPVTVNGNPVEFTGAFPAFFTGSGTLNYSDTFTSRTFAVSAVYYKYWL